jgi:hypothetical protein
VKFLRTLLAIIVLILSVQPVCVGTNSFDSCCQESTCSDNDNNKQEKQSDCSSCNPFQHCGCCAFCVIYTPVSFLVFRTRINFNNNSWGILNCLSHQNPILEFWQPPKLSWFSFLFQSDFFAMFYWRKFFCIIHHSLKLSSFYSELRV